MASALQPHTRNWGKDCWGGHEWEKEGGRAAQGEELLQGTAPPPQGKLVEPFGVGRIGLQSPSTTRLGLQGDGGYGK